MVPQRLSVKFFTSGDKPVDLHPFAGLFHRWIQNNTVEGLLIDVADYKHVPDGPGILLIGHEVDYGIDLAAGKPGLLVRRKRCQGHGTLADVLRDALRKAALAAKAIAADGAVNIALDTTSLEITLIDRLLAPNTDSSLAQARKEIEPVLADIYEEGFEVRRGNPDPRAPLSLAVTAKKAVNFDTLLERLEPNAATV